jgi:hypothetical protein
LLTSSATVRRLINMTALAVVDAQIYQHEQAGEQVGEHASE